MSLVESRPHAVRNQPRGIEDSFVFDRLADDTSLHFEDYGCSRQARAEDAGQFGRIYLIRRRMIWRKKVSLQERTRVLFLEKLESLGDVRIAQD